jgi:hypothetical protein
MASSPRESDSDAEEDFFSVAGSDDAASLDGPMVRLSQSQAGVSPREAVLLSDESTCRGGEGWKGGGRSSGLHPMA